MAIEKTFEDVKSITFKAYFKGDGCVNYDENKQQGILARFNLLPREVNNNVKFAKKTFALIEDSDGKQKVGFKYKVSSECIRHEMFKNEMEFKNPSTTFPFQVLYNAIAQPAMIERGYLEIKDNLILKKKTSVCITSAVEKGRWHTAVDLDFHSVSGAKTNKNKTDDKSNTSIYLNENVGEAIYCSEGGIDLTELQFISGDNNYDRAAVLVDGGEEEKIYLNALRNNFGDDVKFDSYYMKSSLAADVGGERGILLSKGAVDMMVKDIIKRIFNINIYRKDAYFRFMSLQLTVNYGDDNVMHENIYIKSIEELEKFVFNYYTKYIVCDDDKIMKYKENSDEMKRTKKESKK